MVFLGVFPSLFAHRCFMVSEIRLRAATLMWGAGATGETNPFKSSDNSLDAGALFFEGHHIC